MIIDVLDLNDVPVICTVLAPPPAEPVGGTDEGGEGGETTAESPGEVQLCTAARGVSVTDTFIMYEDDVTTTPAFNTSYVVDLDNDPLKFSIDKSIFDGAMFNIDELTGRINVAPGKQLNYEIKQYYKITIVVKDYAADGVTPRGGEARYNFPIEILNANDAPVLAPGLVLKLAENSYVGDTTTMSFAATDVDGGAAQVMTYSLTEQWNSNNVSDRVAVDYFTVDVDPTTQRASVKVRKQTELCVVGMREILWTKREENEGEKTCRIKSSWACKG